ncbi:MAG TPA: ATP-binding protein [Bryobacteraceae bacterium]|nr:ATP-binding protein [Bryobacteraceae bacterium]
MKWTHSIRFRLTLWYSIVMAAGLVLFAVAIWVSMKDSLAFDIDRGLRDEAHRVGLFVNTELREASTILEEELAEYSSGLPDDMYLEVTNGQGVTVFSSHPRFPWPRNTGERTEMLQLKWHDDSYQVLAAPFAVGQQKWHVVLAASLRPLNHLTNRLRLLLLALIPAVALLATLGGMWLSRRALKSVDEITVAARSIGIANLSERLRVPDSNDELQRLSETWNDMLSRLEEAVTRLSQFTSDASHELRTPLAVIRTTAELAVRRSRSAPDYQAALTQILGESERMTRLVDDLLFLAHCDAESQQMPMAVLNLSGLVQSLCSQVAPLASDRQIRIAMQISDGNMMTAGNDLALRRLVLAMLDNAVKYSKPGGTVVVRLYRVLERAVLEIEDEGCGIPAAEIPLVFHRFYRTPQTRNTSVNGYGLGLSLAAAIAQRHHTSIEVQSVPGSGSTFRVSLPLESYQYACGA